MFILITAISAIVIGVLVKWYLDYSPKSNTYSGIAYKITRSELIIGSVICTVLIAPLVIWAGTSMAKSNKLKFHEYWNGYETAALVSTTTCHKDGSCTHTYDCDPYDVWVDTSYTDSNGNYVSQGHYETHYHDCPYATKEYDYVVDTTLGEYQIGSTRFAKNPKVWEGDGSEDRDGWPNVDTGAPKFWTAAKHRIEADDPGPVTKRMEYDNYILASQDTILKKYSEAVDKYKKAKLLPKPAKDTHTYYLADKAYFVGKVKVDRKEWRDATLRMGAALGSDKQGDLHVVLVDANKVTDQHEYSLALYSYWQGPELGKDGASKNTLVLLIGTKDNKTVAWSEAFTGMPEGNNMLLTKLRHDLTGKPLDANILLGKPVGEVSSQGKVKITNGEGIVENLVWDKTNGFERICMVCNDKGDKGTGFTYLDEQIKPSTGQRVAMWFVAMLLSGIVWAIMVGLAVTTDHEKNTRLNRMRYL